MYIFLNSPNEAFFFFFGQLRDEERDESTESRGNKACLFLSFDIQIANSNSQELWLLFTSYTAIIKAELEEK